MMLKAHMFNNILAISPIDGRYREKLEELADYFSEMGLFKYRIKIEIEWLIYLCNKIKIKSSRELSEKEINAIKEIANYFDIVAAKRVKEIEKKTNHDVKAVEYFLKESLRNCGFADLIELVHFGCTSADINNTAYTLMVKDATDAQLKSLIIAVLEKLKDMAIKNSDIPMLSLTHGQPASPTTVGKELAVFFCRIENVFEQIETFHFHAKFNGATGNFSAHYAADPSVDWDDAAEQFLNALGLSRTKMTTQIEPHDSLIEFLTRILQINVILLDLSRDIWFYISRNIFSQKIKDGEIGSTTMPHKVNPIDFENAEGNLGIANALIHHFMDKLPVSRMQRDLSDSTVMRNIGSIFAYTVLAYKSLISGLNKLDVNEKAAAKELENHPEILSEALQSAMRLENVEYPYEKLKKITRGQTITLEKIRKFIDGLDIDRTVKKRLKKLTPLNYIGAAKELTEKYLK